MFAVDDASAASIRRAYEESGELAAVIEFQRHFPLIQDNSLARSCVLMIASWTSVSPPPGSGGAESLDGRGAGYRAMGQAATDMARFSGLDLPHAGPAAPVGGGNGRDPARSR